MKKMIDISYLHKRIKKMNYKSMFERIERIKNKTNKSKIAIFLDMVWCGIRYGAGYVDYDVIGFYKLNSKQRKTILTRGINNKFVKQLNKKESWHIFDNKHEFNKYFNKFVTRDWIYPVTDNKEAVTEWIRKHKIFFAKPDSGQCGKGIQRIEIDKFEGDIYKHLVENKLELLEEPIIQHDKMNQLNPSSVNTIRLVTIMNEENEVTILVAYSRIGNKTHVDNFNSGGMTAKVDVKTGKIMEVAANKKGEIFEKHPTTKMKIVGFQIPMWDDAKKMVIEAAKSNKDVRYIGWDVAITTDGPTLVEGNQFPGHDLYQVAEKIRDGQFGILPEFEKALLNKKDNRTQPRRIKRKIRI